MINLHNIDCMEFMKSVPDKYYELAIVDPPYGINFAKQHTGRGWIVRETKTWDKQRPNKQYFDELFRVSKNQIIWGGNYFVDYLDKSRGWVVWNKMQRNFSLGDGELAYTSFDVVLRIYDMARGKHKAEDDKTGGKIHPTQKPIALYKWLLTNYAKENDKILDTHLGSGSIAIACYDLGFDLDGCEIDKEYFDGAVKRLEDHKNNLQMFGVKN